MTSLKIDNKKQVTYNNAKAVSQSTASKNSTPILSFKSFQPQMGLQVEKTAKKTNPQKTIYLQSGRKVVYSKTASGKIVMKYYGTDGTQLNPNYFKKVEGQIAISADGKSYTIIKNGKKTTLQAKDPSKGAIDQNLARLNNEEKRLKKTKKGQGFIGSSWDWIKNTTGIGDGSDKAQKQIEAERKLLNQVKTGKISKKDFKEVTGVEYSKENLEKFKRGELSQATAKIDGYKEGQEMAVDITSDIVSGAVAYGAAATCIAGGIAAAPFTAGASLCAVAVGVGIAAGAGAATKVAIKGGEALVGRKKYSLKQAGKDATIGAVSGVLAPVTIGAGGAVANSVGKVAPKFIATSARHAIEGGTFGAIDGGTRSVLEGDSIGDVALNTLKCAGVGALAGNVLGHGGILIDKTSSIIIKNIKSKMHYMNIISNSVSNFCNKISKIDINPNKLKSNVTTPKTINNKTLKQMGQVVPEDIIPTIPNANHTSYRFKDSQLMCDFTPWLTKTNMQKGISTKNQIGDCFIKGTVDVPLGTSGVGNCAVICLQNSKTNTHALYHAFPIKRNPIEHMQKDISIIMPEGFDKVFVIPGRDPETAVTSVNLLKAARNINKNAQVAFRHSANGDNVQIILYDGNVYSLPISDGIPVFKICENPENYYIGMKL